MKILALDLGEKTGYAHHGGVSGTWRLQDRNESDTIRFLRLRSKLDEMLGSQGIDLVVFEDTHMRFANAFRSLVAYQTVVKLWCTDRGIPWIGNISPTQIKKHATGRGRFVKGEGKTPMMQAAATKWPLVKLVDDNHADALWLQDLAQSLYGRN